jgi:hypothetical protein
LSETNHYHDNGNYDFFLKLITMTMVSQQWELGVLYEIKTKRIGKQIAIIGKLKQSNNGYHDNGSKSNNCKRGPGKT